MNRGLIILLVSSAITVVSSYFLQYHLENPVEGVPFSFGQIYEILLIVIPLRVWQTYDLVQTIKKLCNNKQITDIPKEFKYLMMIIVATYIIYLIFPVSMYFGFGFANPFFRGSGPSMSPTISDNDTEIEQAGASFDKLNIGDIIAFQRPDGVAEAIQHRIVYIKTDQNGSRIIMTKGDANEAPIPGIDYPIIADNYIGKVVYIFHDPLRLYRLEDIPLYIIVAPAIVSVLYYFRSRKSINGRLN